MFQFKNTEPGLKESVPSNALPNTFGKVRTFKDDLENFQKGATDKDSFEQNDIPPLKSERHPLENISEPKPLPQTVPDTPNEEIVPGNPFQSMPTPPPLSSANTGPGLPEFKSSPSQSFFAEKPAAPEVALPENKNSGATPPRTKRKILLPLVIILILFIAGAGFYYYWFFMRSASPAVSPPPAAQTVPNSPQTAPPASSDAQSKNLRQLVVDTSQGFAETKNAIQKFAAEFAASAAENDLVEVKLIGKDNLPIGKKDFFTGFETTVPEAALVKLSEDYSLFARKEGDVARLGLVFKTVTASGLTDEMKNWEPQIVKALSSLYAGQAPTGTGAFSSNRYKNADIRYFNFSSPAGASLDYSVISNFLVIGTSKDSMRAILDYMSEK